MLKAVLQQQEASWAECTCAGAKHKHFLFLSNSMLRWNLSSSGNSRIKSKRARGSGGVKKLEGLPGDVSGPSGAPRRIDFRKERRGSVARVVRYGNPCWRNWAPLNHCFIECFSPRLHIFHENGFGASVAWRAPNTWYIADVQLLGCSMQG